MTTIEASGLNASHQIGSLCNLQDGWRNGEGIAFDADYLTWLSDAFRRMYPTHALAPTITPTTYGIVAVEWSLPGVEVSLEIDPETRQGDLVRTSANTQGSEETEIDLAAAEGWAVLEGLLQAWVL